MTCDMDGGEQLVLLSKKAFFAHYVFPKEARHVGVNMINRNSSQLDFKVKSYNLDLNYQSI